jgi:hypothetical protein
MGIPRRQSLFGNNQKIKYDRDYKFGVLISGIESSGFDLHTIYNFKVYFRLYSIGNLDCTRSWSPARIPVLFGYGSLGAPVFRKLR